MSDIVHFAKVHPRTDQWYALCGAQRNGREWVGAWSRGKVDCSKCLQRLDALIQKSHERPTANTTERT